MSKPVILETRHARSEARGVTYQLELVLCGKAGCDKRHGPYWYAYWKSGSRTRHRYVGKEFRELDFSEVRAAERAAERRRNKKRGLGNASRTSAADKKSRALGNPTKLPKGGRARLPKVRP